MVVLVRGRDLHRRQRVAVPVLRRAVVVVHHQVARLRVRCLPRVGRGVGLDHDPLVRDAEVAQVLGDRAGQRDVPVDAAPRAAVHGQRGGHHRALRAGAAVAGVHDRGQRERAAAAVVADVAVAEVQRVGADLAVVVHGVDDRQAVGMCGPHDPGGDEGVRVVQVEQVRFVLPDQFPEVPLGGRRADRRDRQQCLLYRRERTDLVRAS